MARRHPFLLLLSSILLLAPCAGAADDPDTVSPELVTDRPDATESAVTVPRGLFQFELGWTHAETDVEGTRTRADSFPETLIRIGLSRRFELRLGFDGYQWDREDPASGPSEDRSGFNNTSVGFKAALAGERGARPQIAVIGEIGIPSGAEELTDSEVVPAFIFAFSNTLNDRLSLGYNLGALWLEEEDESGESKTTATAIWSVALGIGVGEKLGAFVELFGNPILSGAGESSSSFDGGFTYLVRPNVQLDAFAGTGLSGDAPDWFAGLGISFRLPR
jgi:hypothetical protein